jgi:hypothetical protein
MSIDARHARTIPTIKARRGVTKRTAKGFTLATGLIMIEKAG